MVYISFKMALQHGLQKFKKAEIQAPSFWELKQYSDTTYHFSGNQDPTFANKDVDHYLVATNLWSDLARV